MKPMSYRKFGRWIGVDDKTVRNAVEDGRIPVEAVGAIATKTGRTRPVIADPPLAAKCFHISARGRSRAPVATMAMTDYERARTTKAIIAAQREALKYNEDKGLLIQRAKVLVELHTALAALKERLLKLIPRRHAPALDALFEEHEENLRKRIDYRNGGEAVEVDEPST